MVEITISYRRWAVGNICHGFNIAAFDSTKALYSRAKLGGFPENLCVSNTEADATGVESIKLVPTVKPSVD